MKKLVLLLSFAASFSVASAQSFPDYSGIKLDTEADYNEKADEAALQSAQFLLSVTIDRANPQHKAADSYLAQWTDGTPLYTFDGMTAAKIAGKSYPLLVILRAGMVEYALTHKDQKDDHKKTTVNGVKRAIVYVKDPEHKMEPTNEFMQAMDAESKGKLEEHVLASGN